MKNFWKRVHLIALAPLLFGVGIVLDIIESARTYGEMWSDPDSWDW